MEGYPSHQLLAFHTVRTSEESGGLGIALSIPGEQWNAHSPCVAIFHVLASKLAFDSNYPSKEVWGGFIHGGRGPDLFTVGAGEMEVVTGEVGVCPWRQG